MINKLKKISDNDIFQLSFGIFGVITALSMTFKLPFTSECIRKIVIFLNHLIGI